MPRATPAAIRIVGARQHNLRGLDLSIRHDALTVVTGVSGSGKSSLAFDTLFREGQRRYLESLSSHARQLLGKLDRPDVDRVEGIRPALAIDQRAAVRSPRSTVGTLTELYDHLRLLFARVGTAANGTPTEVTSTLLSFNTPQGACPACKGLGVEDRVDPGLLIADPTRTLRQGALVPTTPNGYIVYSQVTVDVLDQVCHAHGFSVDEPWEQLNEEQQRVVLYGSDRIKVPFGKHPLQSRMRWSGITARPRKEGTYRGIVPVIEEIVARSRNRNALRFVRTASCSVCGGARLRPEALALRIEGRSIAGWAALTVAEVARQLDALELGDRAPLAAPLIDAIVARARRIERLGLGHLTLDRPSPSLSAGEVQRLRLATQVATGLRGLLYVLDEPSVGLHGSDVGKLLDTLGDLRDAGNTVVVVEHDPATIRAADAVVDIGPGPGRDGGRLLHLGAPADLLDGPSESPTRAFLSGDRALPRSRQREGAGELWVRGARSNNLRAIDVPFRLGALNVVTGVSGAGKTSLVERILGRALRQRLHGSTERPDAHDAIEGAGALDKVIVVDQSPIGRTPRSNPATYTKVFDAIRGCFASLPAARERGWGKGHFSFNVAGGRCEQCHGAGVESIGMHFLGDVEVTCPACNGDRFDRATLAVEYRGHSVLDVLRMAVDGALELFADQSRICRILGAMRAVGLGYLPLGQPSTTLSGGEAQRIKLAAELGRPTTGQTLLLLDEPTRGLHLADVERLLQDAGRRLTALQDVGLGYITLDRGAPTLSGGEFQRVRLASQLCSQLCGVTYVLDEPTVGLHPRDTARLLSVLRRLRDAGNTVVVVEHDLQVIRAADHVIELGPGAGEAGGRIVAQGPPSMLVANDASPTGRHLAVADRSLPPRSPRPPQDGIRIEGARARNLRAIDVAIPAECLVAVTGVSGSGKTALVFETLAASMNAGDAVNCAALEGTDRFDRTVDVDATAPTGSARGTVATYSEIFDPLRTLLARSEVARERGWGKAWFATSRRGGRCEACEGRGHQVIEMGFLPSVTLPCEECGGSRYADATLDARVDGHSIADVLAMSVATAREAFGDEPVIAGRLEPLDEVGLGYLPLGQPTATLSAGEFQRMKLSRGLATAAGEHRLYLLDEPTCGLHSDDVNRLLDVLHRLVDAGHTVVVIEHDPQVVREADWIVDLGPEGGEGGGRVVHVGPTRPESDSNCC